MQAEISIDLLPSDAPRGQGSGGAA